MCVWVCIINYTPRTIITHHAVRGPPTRKRTSLMHDTTPEPALHARARTLLRRAHLGFWRLLAWVLAATRLVRVDAGVAGIQTKPSQLTPTVNLNPEPGADLAGIQRPLSRGHVRVHDGKVPSR